MRYRDFQSFRATPLLVLIFANILLFIGTTIVSRSTYLSAAVVDQFGISRSTITSHPWTLITAMFLHNGIYHILGNMLWLYWYGTALVQITGEGKFLALYFIGGIIGNAFFLLLSPTYSFAVGASGAVFALGGALAVLRPKIKIVLFPIPIPMDLWVYVIVGFVLMSFLPGVGWQAHLGGLLIGLAAGWYFRRWERQRGIRY
jgi:membrane associated rhomboid family serine protease